MNKVIFNFGLPGSGKGTQADLLEERHGFFHFDTGKEIQKTVHDPANKNDPVIQKQRELFDAGTLCEPWWVKEFVKSRIQELAKEGKSLTFSGSPRTLEEAEYLVSFLEDLYGKENIKAVLIDISEESAVFRNSHRRICKDCKKPIEWNEKTKDLKKCSSCGGELITRGDLDKEEIIKNERIPQYNNRTKPVLEFLEKRNIPIIKIDGEQLVENVHKDVAKTLSLK